MFHIFPSWSQDKSLWHHNGFSDLAIQTKQDDTLNPQPRIFWVSFLILPYTLRSLHSSEQPVLFYFSFLNPSITKCQILSRWVSTTHSSPVVIVTEATRKCYCWIKTRRLTFTMWLVKHQKLWFYFRLPVVSDYLALSLYTNHFGRILGISFDLWVVISQND